MRKKVRTTEADIDYMIECMLSEYSDYEELLKSHNISIFRKVLYQWRKIDKFDFIERKAIHEEILRLGNMLEEDEMVGECKTIELVSSLSDDLLKNIEEGGRNGRTRK